MTNVLTFSAIHKSITSLDTIDLPNFVVLTGKNGSGKTHLLTAIKGGQILSSLVGNLEFDVKVFDSNTIIPKDTGIFDPSSEQSRKFQWFNTISNAREQHFPGIRQFVASLGVPLEFTTSTDKISALSVSKLKEILANPENAENVYAQITNFLETTSAQIYNQSNSQIGDDYWRKAAPKLIQSNPTSFLKASHQEFFENESFLWGDVDPFQQAFGRIFAVYRDLIHSNDRLEKYPPLNDPNRKYLSTGEFVNKNGEPPWDFVNRILEECALDFRVDHPLLHDIASYEPKLQKLSTDVEMRFQDLSSGEKVLMSFALCLYNSQESRQAKSFPKLLLLDEVDGPLHPSMVASLLRTIQNVLVRDKNVAVIMTTHSPTTIALAPEESIFAMSAQCPRVRKISKGAALTLLTTGVPTLSVAFGGRRQVFVESRTDASIYDKLYQRYKFALESERSLTFIEVGNSDNAGGEHNSGCAQVNRLVENLANSGNSSVYGLVDWDGERNPTDRVLVLAHRKRDGLESILFDPVLVVAMAVRENHKYCVDKGLLNATESYSIVLTWTEDRWQTAVEWMQSFILGEELESEVVTAKYLNGMTLSLRKNYLHLDDHALEAAVIKSFSYLLPKNKRAGDLMRFCINTVLFDKPDLISDDLLITFSELLNVEEYPTVRELTPAA